MTSVAPINLDKLRNAVQRFGNLSFTTAQVASDYDHGETLSGEMDTQQFEVLLQRHATVLGISPRVSGAGGNTVWQAV